MLSPIIPRLWKAELGLLLCHPATATMTQQTRKQTVWYTSVRKTVSSRLNWDTYAVLDQAELQSCYVSELYTKTLPQNK